MRYKLLGKSGLRVSELCLGTMTFGEDWGWGASKDESRRIFEAYAHAGGNFIDTSINYTDGTSEAYVGSFIAPDRSYFVVTTKYTISTRPDDPNAGGNSRKNMRQSVERSLKRLQTDYLDLLWLHMWDYMTPVEEVMRGLDDLVRAGKVLYVGVSNAPAWVVAQANTLADLMGWSRFVALQVPYALTARDVERELLPMARAFDMAVTPWGLLGGGVLTGKYNRAGTDPTRYDREHVPEKDLAIAAAVVKMADEIGRTPAQVAINWVRQQRGVIIPILGARTEKQFKDNLACLDFALSDEQMQRLSEASGFEPGFPHDYLHANPYLFGETFDLIDNHRA